MWLAYPSQTASSEWFSPWMGHSYCMLTCSCHLLAVFVSSAMQTLQCSIHVSVQWTQYTLVCFSFDRLALRTWRVCSMFLWLRRRRFSWSKMSSFQLQREMSTLEMPFGSASSPRRESKSRPCHWGRTEKGSICLSALSRFIVCLAPWHHVS